MKLKNKKTGEIGTLIVDGAYKFVTNFAVEDDEMNRLGEYESLAKLNEEWEDYEDELFYIVSADHKDGYICALKEDYKELCDTAKELGIGFETEKEARKALEKLKAWKRLKDRGFKFDKWVNVSGDDCSRPIWFYFMKDTELKEVKHDLDLLFGGEE